MCFGYFAYALHEYDDFAGMMSRFITITGILLESKGSSRQSSLFYLIKNSL